MYSVFMVNFSRSERSSEQLSDDLRLRYVTSVQTHYVTYSLFLDLCSTKHMYTTPKIHLNHVEILNHNFNTVSSYVCRCKITSTMPHENE